MSNALSSIKFKYYEHEYNKTRLLFINSHGEHYKLPQDIAGKYAIDLLCVASHYSQRYNSADGFLEQCTETTLVDHSLYLHRNTKDSIIDTFVEKCIHTCSNTSIKSKSMIFLWKNFLQEINVPLSLIHI